MKKLKMKVVPYKSFGLLYFGVSTCKDCVACYGEPKNVCTNSEGTKELHYSEFIVRFDPTDNTVRECTLLPRATAIIGDIELTWDQEFLRRVCNRDGNPMNVYGFIVLESLGIAVTGIHDGVESQLAITAFSKDDFDALLAEASPFDISSMPD